MIRVQAEDFDIGIELNKLTNGNSHIGGISCFIGLVRDMASNNKIKSMTLEHYPAMTQKALVEIEVEAFSRWDLLDTLIIHRYGKLNPGDQIVMVAAASAHRKAAIEATQFLIDWLKTKAPFWKLEETLNGGQWVDAMKTDEVAAKNWLKKG